MYLEKEPLTFHHSPLGPLTLPLNCLGSAFFFAFVARSFFRNEIFKKMVDALCQEDIIESLLMLKSRSFLQSCLLSNLKFTSPYQANV